MTLLLGAVVVGTVVGWMIGGSLRGLAAASLHGGWIAVCVVCIVGLLPASAPMGFSSRWAVALWLILNGVLFVVAVWNRGAPGFWLVALGLALNLLVVGANLGMPVAVANAPEFPAQADKVESAINASWLYVAADPSTRFILLADVIPIPGPSWYRGMMSLGDAFLMLGVGYFICSSMRSASDDCLETG